MTFKNAIGYIRVSTERQADDDKYGIEVQKQAILLYANDNGYNIVDWKVDEISGAKDDRPGLNETPGRPLQQAGLPPPPRGSSCPPRSCSPARSAS